MFLGGPKNNGNLSRRQATRRGWPEASGRPGLGTLIGKTRKKRSGHGKARGDLEIHNYRMKLPREKALGLPEAPRFLKHKKTHMEILQKPCHGWPSQPRGRKKKNGLRNLLRIGSGPRGGRPELGISTTLGNICRGTVPGSWQRRAGTRYPEGNASMIASVLKGNEQ